MNINDRNMKTMRLVILGLFVACLTTACSVKEDRQECPCRLVMDLTSIDTSVVSRVEVLAVSSEGIVFSDSISASDFGREYVREVPHKAMKVNVWGGKGTGTDLKIPYGCESPYMYMHVFEPDTSGEEWCGKVLMKKSYCRLTVHLEGRGDMPYSLTFRGNVDGYELDGLPSGGEFACVAYPSDDAGAQVILPRQTDSSLMLEVEDVEIPFTKIFAIGEYLAAAGYDWTAENLEDATVVIDYYLTGIKVTYKGWDKEYSYDIIL